MIDSHTHLDSCAPENDELVGNARAAGVRRILTVGHVNANKRVDLVIRAIGARAKSQSASRQLDSG